MSQSRNSVGIELYYDTCRTPVGWCAVVTGPAGLKRIFLAEPGRKNIEASVARQFPGSRADKEVCRDAIAFISGYFEQGASVQLPGQLDFEKATAFQRRVWKLAVTIPFGQVRSYGWMAKQLGCRGAARAAGSALGRNPLPLIVPCHRIVCSSGRMGGFSAGGGTVLKRRLLEHEGIKVDSQGRVVVWPDF